MKEIFKQLIDAKLDWEEVPNSSMLQARFRDKVASLRFNDWPEEVLCTIFVDADQQDWEDFPSNWTLPEHRQLQKA